MKRGGTAVKRDATCKAVINMPHGDVGLPGVVLAHTNSEPLSITGGSFSNTVQAAKSVDTQNVFNLPLGGFGWFKNLSTVQSL